MTDSPKIPLIEIPDASVLNLRKWLTIAWAILVLVYAAYFTYQSVYLGNPIEASTLFNIFVLPLSLVIIGASQKSSYIQIDGHTIKYKTNFFKPATTIKVSEITAINIDFTDVTVTTKNGKTHQIDIGTAKHSDIGRIKSKLQEIQF